MQELTAKIVRRLELSKNGQRVAYEERHLEILSLEKGSLRQGDDYVWCAMSG